MSYYNTSTNHPIIDNSQEYTIEKKYVSIHSEDRNILKFPNPSDFEIQLPQDYLNVTTIKLSRWSFPSNFDVFSPFNENTVITFHFTNVYNPTISPSQDNYAMKKLIYNYLNQYQNTLYNTNDFVVIIENGYYNPEQMANELTNQFNAVVTNYLSVKLQQYDDQNGTTYNSTFLNYNDGIIKGGYHDFIIAYNEIEEKLYFGNQSSGFSLKQNLDIINNYYSEDNCVLQSHTLPDNLQPVTTETTNTKEKQKKDATCNKKFNNNESIQNSFADNYLNGLPFCLGLNTSSLNSTEVTKPITNPKSIPRFFYQSTTNDNGFWLTPNNSLPSSNINYIAAPNKINLLGPSYFYLEIAGLNYIDETSPFNTSQYTIQNNQTNGIVNSSFAKIGITTQPLSKFYNTTTLDMDSYKYFNPPAERIRKLKIKIRYHNGQYVNFNNSSFSFTLEFTMFKPQILRNMITSKSYTTL